MTYKSDMPRQRNPTKRAVWTTVIFCVLTIVAAPGYWIMGALASWGGPEDDIAIVYLLTPFVLLHAFLVSRGGLRLHFFSALAYISVVSSLLIARHIEISGRGGYDRWHANRSLESLGWLLVWSTLALAFSLVRWYAAPEPELDEKPNDRNV